jgi:hypothetical protein
MFNTHDIVWSVFMAKIRQRDKDSVMNALAGGVTPRQGIQFIQVGRKQETEALLADIKNVEAGNSSFRILDASYGGGKALPLDTPVLTDHGWVKNGNLRIGDVVYDINGDRQRVEMVHERPRERRYVLMLSDGREYACSGEHLWQVYELHDDSMTTKPMTTMAIMDGLHHGTQYMIPCPSAIKTDDVPLDEQPMEFGKFVGTWSWDASRVTPEIVEPYVHAGTRQRHEFLDGIVRASGRRDDKYKTVVSLMHKWIADAVVYVARSLGMHAMSERVHIDTQDSNELYSITIIGYDFDDGNRHVLGTLITDVQATALYEDMRCLTVSGDTHTYVIDGFLPTHNTFMLTLTKTVALKRNDLVTEVDFSPDRRLYSSSGKARALYQELIRSLSSMTSPDGGALDELLDALDERVGIGDTSFMRAIRKMPYGFDAVTVMAKWHIARNPQTEKERRDAFILQDACLRWFASEDTPEHRKLLGVKAKISDDGAYDALKLIAMLAHYAGYGGLIVELDECVNLYKINNSTARDRNYEQILRMFNEARQGDAHYIGFVLAGTPEFVLDSRKGLFSYDALKGRLSTSRYAANDGTIDKDAPIIDLTPLTLEHLFVLLKNIVNVDALGDQSKYVMTDDDIKTFLSHCSDTLGADFYRTPREVIRDFVAIVSRLDSHPDLKPSDVIQATQPTQSKRESGLGSAMARMSKPAKAKGARGTNASDDDEEEEFGF